MSLPHVRSLLRLAGCLAAATLALPASASHVRRGPTAPQAHHHARSGRASRSASHTATSSHPRAIDDARATEIQTALVKAGYLQNTSGHWDEASADAMRKLQADNGWQTKLIPDSRALIKLGLGANSGSASPDAVNLIGSTE